MVGAGLQIGSFHRNGPFPFIASSCVLSTYIYTRRKTWLHHQLLPLLSRPAWSPPCASCWYTLRWDITHRGRLHPIALTRGRSHRRRQHRCRCRRRRLLRLRQRCRRPRRRLHPSIAPAVTAPLTVVRFAKTTAPQVPRGARATPSTNGACITMIGPWRTV